VIKASCKKVCSGEEMFGARLQIPSPTTYSECVLYLPACPALMIANRPVFKWK